MWIRIWNGCLVVADLEVDGKGGSTWSPKPSMPNNAQGYPDLEIDPWARAVRHQRNDVEFYGRADEYSAIDDADD